MKKIKIFYSDRSSTLSSGLDYLQGKVNTWINESGAEIVDVKMNINNHDNPIITVIYTEPDPYQDEQDGEVQRLGTRLQQRLSGRK